MALSPVIPYLTPTSRLVNEALDILGRPEKVIGDVSDGSAIAECARRNYGQGLRQLLRTAHWDFARVRAPLTLLGTNVVSPPPAGVSSIVECPWSFAYAWPVDAVMGRWLPWNPTGVVPTSTTGVPLTTGPSGTGYPYYSIPGRFLVSSSAQYPLVTGVLPWPDQPDLQRTEGAGPVYRKIILTDCCNADFVYTRLSTVVEEWDALFRQAFVTMLALVLAPVAIEDPKERLIQSNRLIPVLKNAIADARVANGNESGYPQTTDFEASFIQARNTYGFGYANGFGTGLGGIGYFNVGWDQMSWGGSVF